MFQGSFDTVSLDEVLSFLATGSKTGVLRISGDRGTGSVWVEDGQMVAADATHGVRDPDMEEVLFELLRFKSGNFSFDFDETNANPGTPVAIDGVLAQANKLLVEWRGIELVIPGLDYRIAPAPTLPAEQVTVTEDEWATILAVGGNASVEEIANRLDLGELEGLRRLRGLIERKLVVLGEPHSEVHPEKTRPEAAPHAEDSFDEVESRTLGFEPPTRSSGPTGGSDSYSLDVPPPVGPSARRLSAKRGLVTDREIGADEGRAAESEQAVAVAAHEVPAAQMPAPQVSDNLSDPFADSDARPPMPPPPPMPSAPAAPASAIGADVPPPPAPPSPAEIAKFGSSVEDASSIEDSGSDGESSLLMRYLQSEG